MEMQLLLLIIFVTAARLCCCVMNEEFPDITDLFPTEAGMDVSLQLNMSAQKPSFDLETIDLGMFKKKIEEFSYFVAANNPEGNETRRQLPYYKERSYYEWVDASQYMARRKMLDNCLTLVYMARHKVRELESNPMFNTKDTSYRIAFLYRRMRRMWKKVMDIYTLMYKYRWNTNWRSKMARAMPALKLHHRAIKLSIDFTYFWYVLLRLHERYTYRNHIIMTRPVSDRYPTAPPTPFTTTRLDAKRYPWYKGRQ